MEKLEKFRLLGLSHDTLLGLKKKGFEEPTPIQEKIIPMILTDRGDLIGQAQTGTGKTAAFGIPILEKIEQKSKFVQTLILVPTRELAIQVAEELNSLRGNRKLQIIPVYGGQAIELQLKRLKKGVDVVVGTPGRILDHLKRRTLQVDLVSYVVLDEADEMLNMGFLEDVQEILDNTNPERTTLLFSATMPPEIVRIAKRYMKDFEIIATRKKQVTVDLTEQIYFEVPAADKFEALCRIIDIEAEFYGLVFCRTKVDVDQISSHLIDRGYEAEGLHGDMSQSQREKILNKFRKKRINILIATDVAARGIDIQNLTHVINYTIPQDSDAYVHRIGRTGRAGQEGTAITFITPAEYRKLMYIKRAAKTDIRKEKLPAVKDVIRAKKARVMSEIDSLSHSRIPEEYIGMAQELLKENEPEQAVAALLKYALRDELDPTNYNEIRDTYPQIKGKTRLMIARGKRDRMTKRRLVEFIKKKSRVEDRNIDNVQVLDHHSFITVPFREAEKILHVFKNEYRGKAPFVRFANDSG
ncbi:MAG TPA: DEAD/DEAH box helicase [Caldithrix sp.]|nr:DEAD/DEAH box helicase [Caldithrix sp.]